MENWFVCLFICFEWNESIKVPAVSNRTTTVRSILSPLTLFFPLLSILQLPFVVSFFQHKILIKWICDTLYGFPIKKNNGFYFYFAHHQQQTVKNSPRKWLSQRARARDGGSEIRHDFNTFPNCSLSQSYRRIWTVLEIENKDSFRISVSHSIPFVVIKHCTIVRHICYEFSLVLLYTINTSISSVPI